MTWLPIVQIVLSILIIICILLQQRGTGLSVTFGGIGGGEFYHSRRGIEKILLYSTVVLITALVVVSLIPLFVK